jgi:cytochrome bd-type quinol oxidase subunit 1
VTLTFAHTLVGLALVGGSVLLLVLAWRLGPQDGMPAILVRSVALGFAIVCALLGGLFIGQSA